jgi:hypothetical protein
VAAHYLYDVAGTKHDYLLTDGRKVALNLVPEIATLCWHANGPAGVDTYKGVDTYVTVSVAQDLITYRTRGRPCEWVGPWDALSLNNVP